MIVADASLFGQILFGEPGGDAAELLVADSDVLAPPVLRIELCNLIRRAGRRGRWTAETAHVALQDFCNGIEFEPDGAELGDLTLAFALELDHAAQDCAYLAVAYLRDAPLYTADAAFARKARAKGHDVRTP